MYRSCEHDLTRDGHLETFQVTAVGVEWEKMQFRLNVLSHAGELLFSDEWTSQWYFAAPLRFNPYTPEGGERLITMRMDGMVDRPSFRIGFMDGGNPRNLRYAVRTELGDEATDDRVEALSSELSKALFYYYVKGHEDISALAWSRLENRLVLLSPVI